jgi:hypothetical protein
VMYDQQRDTFLNLTEVSGHPPWLFHTWLTGRTELRGWGRRKRVELSSSGFFLEKLILELHWRLFPYCTYFLFDHLLWESHFLSDFILHFRQTTLNLVFNCQELGVDNGVWGLLCMKEGNENGRGQGLPWSFHPNTRSPSFWMLWWKWN